MKRNYAGDNMDQSENREAQAIKKQRTDHRPRNIRSLSSERTVQLLFQGAAQVYDLKNAFSLSQHCFYCHVLPYRLAVAVCFYCNRTICQDCIRFCYDCKQDYCKNCAFPPDGTGYSTCYSCYK